MTGCRGLRQSYLLTRKNHQMMNKQFTTEFEDSTAKLLDALSVFNDGNFNTIPFEGSWTAGQVAEHVFKSEGRLPGLLLGHTAPADRDPAGNVAQIRKVFLDFSTKLQSPAFILPSEDAKDRTEMIGMLERNREEMGRIIREDDLTLICEDDPFPGVGCFTRLEWVCFMNCHALRHAHQLNHIHQVLRDLRQA